MIRELKRQGLSKKDIMEYLEYENTERFYSNKHISRLEEENTKLEKENKKLKSKIFWLEQEKVDFRESIGAYLSMLDERDNRIDKAIEYIENNSLYKEVVDYDYEENPIYVGANDEEAKEDLLNILKGGKNE